MHSLIRWPGNCRLPSGKRICEKYLTQSVILAQIIQPVTDARPETTPHQHRTQSPDLRLPVNAVIAQTLTQHTHIEAGVMRNQNSAVHHRRNLRPQLGKHRGARHCLCTDAGEPRVEPVKGLLRINKRKIFLHDPVIFNYTDANCAHPVVEPVGRFHIKSYISV